MDETQQDTEYQECDQAKVHECMERGLVFDEETCECRMPERSDNK